MKVWVVDKAYLCGFDPLCRMLAVANPMTIPDGFSLLREGLARIVFLVACSLNLSTGNNR
jgi:hypothetical protein